MVIGPIDYSVRFTRLVGQKYASCATNVLVLLKKGRTPLGAWLGPAIGGAKMQGIDIYSKVRRQASTDSVENTPPTWSLDDSIPSQRWGPKFFLSETSMVIWSHLYCRPIASDVGLGFSTQLWFDGWDGEAKMSNWFNWLTEVCTQTPNWTRLGETWRLSCPQWSQYWSLLWSNVIAEEMWKERRRLSYGAPHTRPGWSVKR